MQDTVTSKDKIEDTTDSKKVRNVIFICFIAALAGLLFGLDVGYVNGALELIQKELSLTTAQEETVTSILMLGAAIGSICSGFISHRIGRKSTLVISALLFTIFSIVGMNAPGYNTLLVSRAVLGFSVGIASFIAPLYLSEISPRRMRGGLIAMYQLMITVGILGMFISNYLLASYGSWRLMMITIVVPAVIMLIGCLFLPRSPRWLVLKGRTTEAMKTLMRLRRKKDVAREINEIKESAHLTSGGISGLWKTNWLWKVILLGIFLQVLQQFSGMNAFMYYSTLIFKAAGFSQGNFSTIIVGITNVLSTFIAIAFVDRLGRKPILYTGLVLLAISLLTIGHLFSLQTSGIPLSAGEKNLLFAASLLFIFSFAVSLGPIIWIICAEICPLQYRDFGITCSTSVNWIANMIIGRYTLSMFHEWGYGETFYVFAICCIVGIGLINMFTPETKGISLEQMEKNLKNGVPLKDIGTHTNHSHSELVDLSSVSSNQYSVAE